MYPIASPKGLYHVLIYAFVSSFAFGQSIFTNSITGTNPNTSHPYTTGQVVDANITVSGIGRGPGISGVNATNRYNANNWNLLGLNTDDYFEFILTPNTCHEIDFVSFVYTAQRTLVLGPASFAFRCSVDSYASNIGSPTATGTTIDLSAYQNIMDPITFRFYAYGGLNLLDGYFSINDFTFNGVVSRPTTTWSGGSWSSGLPTSSTNVVIADDYSTSAGGDQISFSACSLTINAGFTLTIDNNTYVDVEHDAIVDGDLFVDTKGSFVQHDDAGTFTVNSGGTTEVFKLTADKQVWYYYTYWSSPVVGATIEDVFPNTPASRRFWFNAANYLDMDGDNIDDNGDDWTIAAGTDVMAPGLGYAATSGQSLSYPGPDSASFVGPFNTGDISTGIVYNAANVNGSWNLIGNPYTSPVDFVTFQAANAAVLDGAAYFWSQSLPPLSTNPGNEVLNFNQNDYATYTVGSGGAAGASGVIPDQYIPTCQSFFIAGLANGTATFTNAMRMADATSNSQFFRTSNQNAKSKPGGNKLWIDLTSDHGGFNQVLIAYVDGAPDKNDGMAYDAPRLLASNYSFVLYSTIKGSNKKYAVQGKAAKSLSKNEVIALGFATHIDVPTLYTFSIAQLQGEFLSSNTLYIKDNLNHKVHNLSDSDYSFTSETGEFNNRFELGFNPKALAPFNDHIPDDILIKIINLKNGHVQFTAPDGLSITSVSVFDLKGPKLREFKGQNTTEVYDFSTLNNPIYIAKVRLSNGVVVTKKVIIHH
jgi:hypothetical protein